MGIKNYKNEKNLFRSFGTYFLFTSVILLDFLCLKITHLNASNNSFSKTAKSIVFKFHIQHDQTPGF